MTAAGRHCDRAPGCSVALPASSSFFSNRTQPHSGSLSSWENAEGPFQLLPSLPSFPKAKPRSHPSWATPVDAASQYPGKSDFHNHRNLEIRKPGQKVPEKPRCGRKGYTGSEELMEGRGRGGDARFHGHRSNFCQLTTSCMLCPAAAAC